MPSCTADTLTNVPDADTSAAAEPLVDLRSDTVTKPTAVMRRAMANAVVGDDGYGEDPTVRELEESFAERLGKEAAVYVPSGTMANQIALRLLGRPGTRVVAGQRQHVVVYEAGAAGLNSSTQFHLVPDSDGLVHVDDVRLAVAEADHHQPAVSAVFVENTHMPAGGVPWPLTAMQELGAVGVPVHLDGARLFNAEVATGVTVAEYAASATTVMCCLSKGLAAPVGSLLAGSDELIAEARVERKRLGGAMRQAGVIAAAGLVGLREMVGRLADDHRRAKRLAEAVAEQWPRCGLDPTSVQTNVVVFRHPDPLALLRHLRDGGVLGWADQSGRRSLDDPRRRRRPRCRASDRLDRRRALIGQGRKGSAHAGRPILRSSGVALLDRPPFAHRSKGEHGHDRHTTCGEHRADDGADAGLHRAVAVALQVDERVTDETAGRAGQQDQDEGQHARSHRR